MKCLHCHLIGGNLVSNPLTASDLRYFVDVLGDHRRECGPSCYNGDQIAAILAAHNSLPSHLGVPFAKRNAS